MAEVSCPDTEQAAPTGDAPHAYVRRMCVNLAASSFRRRATALRTLLRLSPQGTAGDQLPDTPAGFWAEVRRLPRRQAQTIAVYYGCVMSIAEIAETLDMAGGTVKVHLSRARHALADRLSTPEHREGVAL